MNPRGLASPTKRLLELGLSMAIAICATGVKDGEMGIMGKKGGILDILSPSFDKMIFNGGVSSGKLP